MLKNILIAIAVVLAALVAVIMTRPDSFRIERTADIAAPAPIVYEQLVDFHNWAKFSPWEKLDPEMKKTYEGAPSGVGASYSWVGNNKTGEGRMTITEATAPEHVGIKLEFTKPFEATNKTDFNLKQTDTKHTNVAWVMTGPSNFVSKAMGLFMDMDALVGSDFEKGLASLKTLSEEQASAAAAAAAVPPLPTPTPAPAPVKK